MRIVNPSQAFGTWEQVLAFAKLGGDMRYQAPLDTYARRISAKSGAYTRYRVNGSKIRITPPKHEADAFTADAGHLDRFYKPSVCPVCLDPACETKNRTCGGES
ncbi:MAG TPA: hypothetical protein VIK52_01195 [Opitutaceae bacterium]